MIPSQRWFPTSLPGRAAWYQNFSKQMTDIGATLGFSAAEISGFEDDNSVIQFLANSFNQIKAYESALTQYRRIITEGDIGDPTPDFPANPALALPNVIATGIFQRLNDAVERIRAAPNYTDEIGALFGILPRSSDPRPPADVKPTIQVFAAATGYMFTVVVAEREAADMWEVSILKKGGSWTSAGSYTGKSGDVTIAPTSPGDAEQIQVRVQLKKSNANYGQPSDVVYVTVNP